jgi:hypothetical protein
MRFLSLDTFRNNLPRSGESVMSLGPPPVYFLVSRSDKDRRIMGMF